MEPLLLGILGLGVLFLVGGGRAAAPSSSVPPSRPLRGLNDAVPFEEIVQRISPLIEQMRPLIPGALEELKRGGHVYDEARVLEMRDDVLGATTFSIHSGPTSILARMKGWAHGNPAATAHLMVLYPEINLHLMRLWSREIPITEREVRALEIDWKTRFDSLSR